MPANFDTDSRRDNIEISDLTELSDEKSKPEFARPFLRSNERQREKNYFSLLRFSRDGKLVVGFTADRK